jgi:DNA-binding transcriptional LysR family regulator
VAEFAGGDGTVNDSGGCKTASPHAAREAALITASPRRLAVFKSVVDCGGFNLAAMELGIAQPSVGAHIKALERQVGQPLFHRKRGSRPVLTKAGEALYDFAIDTLRRSAEASSVLTDLRMRDASEVSLALHRDLAPLFLATHLSRFAARFPKIRMITRTGTIEDLLALVRERIVHLACVLTSGPLPGLTSEVLTHMPVFLVVAPDHPLARRRRVSPADVMQFPFFTGLRNSRYMAMITDSLAKIGIDRLNVAMELQDAVSIMEMVRLRGGIAAITACAAEQEIERGNLVCLRLEKQLPDLEVRCAYLSPLSPSSQNCLEFLRATPD